MTGPNNIHPGTTEWDSFIYIEIISDWEKRLKNATFPNFVGSKYEAFVQSAGIERRSFPSNADCHTFCSDASKIPQSPYILIADQKKNAIEMTFRRFRNAFAHANHNICGDWVELNDKSIASNKNPEFITMKVRLRTADLVPLVQALKAGVS